MPTTGEPHPLLPNAFYTVPLETWAAAILRLSSEAKQCFLELVVHYKARSDMEHEFLVVYASHPSGSKIVLGIDRNAQDSARALSKLVCLKSPPLPSSSSEKESPHLAYDRVQISHDGSPAPPILAQYGSRDLLYTISFSPTSTSSSNSEARRPPSILNLSVLLLTTRAHFPSYALLKYQCYFFARVTCLALVDLFGVVETELEEGQRAETWRGVHVSRYSAALLEALPLAWVGASSVVLQKVFASPAKLKMLLPETIANPVLLVPVALMVVYNAVTRYDGEAVKGEDMRRISDEKMRQLGIPDLYRTAWSSLKLE